MSTSSIPPILRSFGEIAGDYDAAICDVWGVLHNGVQAFFPAADAMRRFRSERGPVVLLSNAPRLGDGVEALFERLNLPCDFYDSIVTSGVAARADLEHRTAGEQPLRLFYLGPPRDNPIFRDLKIAFSSPEEADVVFCTGLFDDDNESPDDYRGLLEQFRARNLPFLCANPDVVVQRGDKLVYCAGAIARAYESMGGEVVYYGKPYPAVFERAIAQARLVGPAARPLVIGDGIETDVAGAHRLRWDALFIAGGIHSREGPEAIAALLRDAGVSARAMMPALRW